jgi:hypothetical protein
MGRVIRRIIAGDPQKRFVRGERRPDRHFSETLMRAYYQRECEQGSQFRSTFTKNQIKRVHETRLAEYDQTGRRD